MQLIDFLAPAIGVAFVAAFITLVARKAASAAWTVVVFLARAVWWGLVLSWFRPLWYRYVG